MQDSIKNKSRNLLIYTIHESDNSEVSFCPERGGIITSLVLKGKEILYLDTETFEDISKNVRGGIPILFPNAGALEGDSFPLLQQHGFARNSSDWSSRITANGFTESLISDEESKQIFPCDFMLSVEGSFEKDGSFTLTQKVENKNKENMLPIAMGIHPYFKVLSKDKDKIKFNFKGGEYIEEQFSLWSQGSFVSVDNPNIHNESAYLEVIFPDGTTLRMDISPEYKKVWIWSLPEKDFICIEPVMRDVNGLHNDPYMIKPEGHLTLRVNYSII